MSDPGPITKPIDPAELIGEDRLERLIPERRTIVATGQRLRALREERGHTQMELSERSGLDQRQISDIERGATVNGPTLVTLQRLADALRCPLAQFVKDGSDEAESAATKSNEDFGRGMTVAAASALFTKLEASLGDSAAFYTVANFGALEPSSGFALPGGAFTAVGRGIDEAVGSPSALDCVARAILDRIDDPSFKALLRSLPRHRGDASRSDIHRSGDLRVRLVSTEDGGLHLHLGLFEAASEGLPEEDDEATRRFAAPSAREG